MPYKLFIGPRYFFLAGLFYFLSFFFAATLAPAELTASAFYNDDRLYHGMRSFINDSVLDVDLMYTQVKYDPGFSSSAQASASNVSLERFLLDVTNSERSKNGLKALKSLKKMDELAFTHSSDMCRSGVLAHESERFPSGRQKFQDRMKSIGLSSGAENIAFHSDMNDRKILARKIVEGWMKSPEHRTNILSAKFVFVGFGVKNCKDGLIYVTQLFTDRH